LALTTSSPPNWTPAERIRIVLTIIESGKRTVHEGIVFVGRDLESRLGLAEEWDNSVTRVSTNNRDGGLRGVLLATPFLDESLGTHNIQSGDTEETLGFENTGSLEDLGGNGDGGVDGIGNDEHKSLGAELCNALDQSLDDTGVDLEEVVTGHSRLA
jgi:hypothetical protein